MKTHTIKTLNISILIYQFMVIQTVQKNKIYQRKMCVNVWQHKHAICKHTLHYIGQNVFKNNAMQTNDFILFQLHHFIKCQLAFHNNWHDLKMIFIYNNQYWISALVTYFLRQFAVTFTLKLRESLCSQIIESVSCAENSCNWISLIRKWTIQNHWKDSDMAITLHSRLSYNIMILFLERTIRFENEKCFLMQ